jgi:hypothetical protein
MGLMLCLFACTGSDALDSEACGGDEDGDGIEDCAELDLGTDPRSADSDGDGLSDRDELDCGADPLDAEDLCYACGWDHGDPGDLVSTGAAEGDVIANLEMIDQCGEAVDLWDFTGEYYVLFMTAAW